VSICRRLMLRRNNTNPPNVEDGSFFPLISTAHSDDPSPVLFMMPVHSICIPAWLVRHNT
jgi:hypothetical protein